MEVTAGWAQRVQFCGWVLFYQQVHERNVHSIELFKKFFHTDGDTMLGGEDFNEQLLSHFSKTLR